MAEWLTEGNGVVDYIYSVGAKVIEENDVLEGLGFALELVAGFKEGVLDVFVGSGDGNSVDCVGIREIEEGDKLMALGSRLDFIVGFKEDFLDIFVGSGDGNSEFSLALEKCLHLVVDLNS